MVSAITSFRSHLLLAILFWVITATAVQTSSAQTSSPDQALQGSLQATLSGILPSVHIVPKLTYKAPMGELHMLCKLTNYAATSCGYAYQAQLAGQNTLIWGAGWTEKAWLDPGRLVHVVGSAGDEMKIRLLGDNWGVHTATNQVAVRWEQEQKTKEGAALVGVLANWGKPSQTDNHNMNDPSQCVDDFLEEPNLDQSNIDTCSTQTMDTSSKINSANTVKATALPLDRLVTYIGISSDNWQWQSSVAQAFPDTPQEAGAASVEVNYKSDQWRMGIQASYQEPGFRVNSATPSNKLQHHIAWSSRRIALEWRTLWEQKSDSASTTRRFTLAGHEGISPAQTYAVYTAHQIEEAKKPAWRVQAEWTTDDPTGNKNLPSSSLLGNNLVTRWLTTAEGVLPVGGGTVAAKVSLAESRNGRLNWWYVRPTGERALNAQSNLALHLEAIAQKPTQVGTAIHMKLIYAEEVQYDPKPDKSAWSSFWLLEPSLKRKINDQLTTEYRLGIGSGNEFSGAKYQEVVPSFRVAIQL